MAVTATHGLYARAGAVQLDYADGQHAVEVRRPITRISRQKSGFDANLYVSANLGIGILKQFNLTFDYSRRVIIFGRNHNYGTPDIFNRAGFVVRPGDDQVLLIFPRSPAEEAGLRKGIHILSLNGRTPGTLTRDELSALLRGPIGSELLVEFSGANGVPQRRTLRLRELL